MSTQTAVSAPHSEGRVAAAIENQTAKLPSDTFLWAALGSIGASIALQVIGQQKLGNFVGQWAPTILILGVYNKIVKLQGSDNQGRSTVDGDTQRRSVADSNLETDEESD